MERFQTISSFVRLKVNLESKHARKISEEPT
jgi:hypothetical protein